jgi:hypothetical protein
MLERRSVLGNAGGRELVGEDHEPRKKRKGGAAEESAP